MTILTDNRSERPFAVDYAIREVPIRTPRSTSGTLTQLIDTGLATQRRYAAVTWTVFRSSRTNYPSAAIHPLP